MANGRWQMADGRWQMADGRWQMTDIFCGEHISCLGSELSVSCSRTNCSRWHEAGNDVVPDHLLISGASAHLTSSLTAGCANSFVCNLDPFDRVSRICQLSSFRYLLACTMC